MTTRRLFSRWFLASCTDEVDSQPGCGGVCVCLSLSLCVYRDRDSETDSETDRDRDTEVQKTLQSNP
jgi:hypothetical protein